MKKKVLLAIKIVIWLFCAFMLWVCFTDIKQFWLFAVLMVGLAYITYKIPFKKKPKKEKPKKQKKVKEKKVKEKKIEKKPEPIAEPPKRKTEYSFFVTGTNYEQQDGMTGQEILAKVPLDILRERDEKLYGGYTLKEMEEDYITEVDIYSGNDFDVEVEEYEFEGEYAARVFLLDDEENKYQIGNIRRVDLNLFRDIYAQRRWMKLEVDGGKVKDVLGEIEEKDYEPILYIYI